MGEFFMRGGIPPAANTPTIGGPTDAQIASNGGYSLIPPDAQPQLAGSPGFTPTPAQTQPYQPRNPSNPLGLPSTPSIPDAMGMLGAIRDAGQVNQPSLTGSNGQPAPGMLTPFAKATQPASPRFFTPTYNATGGPVAGGWGMAGDRLLRATPQQGRLEPGSGPLSNVRQPIEQVVDPLDIDAMARQNRKDGLVISNVPGGNLSGGGQTSVGPKPVGGTNPIAPAPAPGGTPPAPTPTKPSPTKPPVDTPPAPTTPQVPYGSSPGSEINPQNAALAYMAQHGVPTTQAERDAMAIAITNGIMSTGRGPYPAGSGTISTGQLLWAANEAKKNGQEFPTLQDAWAQYGQSYPGRG